MNVLNVVSEKTEFVINSLFDWKPVQFFQCWCDMSKF